MTNRETFRNNLIKLMNTREGNQIDLAKNVGVSKQTVSSWICGKAYPRADVMERIARYFNVTLPDLVYDPKERQQEAEIVFWYHRLPEEGKTKLLERTKELAIIYGLK